MNVTASFPDPGYLRYMPRICFVANAIAALTGMLGVVACTTISSIKGPVPPPPSARFSHDLYDRVLQRYVDSRGRVDYSALKQHQGELDRYLNRVAAYSPDTNPELFPSRADRLAYWINGYNAAAIKAVLYYYPIESVLDVKRPALLFFFPGKSGFFYFQRVAFGGEQYSLYHLENNVIRDRFKEPRIHFALNCASIGCPRLPQNAFSANDLDAQLEGETLDFLAEKRNLRLDRGSRTIYLSEIFDWYEDDFVDWYRREFPSREASVLAYVALYAPEGVADLLRGGASRYSVRFTPYDWRLNDQRMAD